MTAVLQANERKSSRAQAPPSTGTNSMPRPKRLTMAVTHAAPTTIQLGAATTSPMAMTMHGLLKAQ